MPRELAVYRQLDGLLALIPVVALIARPVESAIREDESWLESIRIWCFIQHLDAVYSGRPVGKYLTTVTEKIRISVDRGTDWQELIVKLKGPTDSLHQLTQHLSAKCTSLLEDRAEKSGMKPAHRQFLSELRAFCQGRVSSSNTDATLGRVGVFWQYINTDNEESSPWQWIPDQISDLDSFDESDSRPLGDLNFDQAGDESVVTVVEVDELDPPPVQTRKARGVLLAGVEDQQFLRYAWNRPTPQEAAALERWIESVWATSGDHDHVVALACWLALRTAHSIRTVQTLQISSEITDDWTLHPGDWSLVRHPPKRYNGWRAGPEHQQWIHPRAHLIQIHLPDLAREILAGLAAKQEFQNGTLADLLPDAGQIESRFNEICKHTPHLTRLLSGMLKQQLAQQVFDQSQDATLAQLLASHPRSGLPGSCAYAAFTSSEVKHALPDTARIQISGSNDEPGEINAAGSELDPFDGLLAGAFRSALERVQRLGKSPEKWTEYHNALTGYCMVALLSATGARPVTSPFESLLHFDLDHKLLFVDDKHTNAQHQGRVIPLPNAATTLMRDVYLPHLSRLKDIIDRQDQSLAKRVDQLILGHEQQELPLFFFLASVPALSWVEISEATLDALELFDWPLPWNLLRHRLSIRLRRLGVSEEIIDGLLGHSNQGTVAYGYFSSRTFSTDGEFVRPMLESLYSDLVIELPTQPVWPVDDAASVNIEERQDSEKKPKPYGVSARRARRKHDHDQARRAALYEIEQFISGRPLESIGRESWDSLSQSMLLQPTGMPHPLGGLRYETMMDWLNERWNDQASRPSLRRRYLPVLEEPSLFNEFSVRASSIASRVRQALEPLKQIHISRLSLRHARLLGCLSLIAEARIADRTLVKDVAAGRNVRLVKFEEHIYLEHGTGMQQWPDAPVRRFWIPEHTARWLDRSLETRSTLDLTKPQKTSLLTPVFEAVDRDAKLTSPIELLDHLCMVVDQENAISLPGYVAAYLGGQVVSAALHHEDWLRVAKGHAVKLPQVADDAVVTEAIASEPSVSGANDDMEASELDTDDSFTLNTSAIFPIKARSVDRHMASRSPNISVQNELAGCATDRQQAEQQDQRALAKTEAQRSAHRFFKDIRTAINKQGKKASSPRRDLDSALRGLIEGASDVSPTCRLLGEWTRSLLWRRTGKGLLRLSSVDRYLNALSSCFETEAYDHNLFDADTEDLTDLYTRLLEARRLSKVSSPESEDDQGSTSEGYRSWRLAANLLLDFHRMCARELSLEDPDWSEFLGPDVPLSISPGFVLEKEYLHALEVLVGDAVHATFDALTPAFMLLLTYRFGLRGKEAAGLMRTDWVTAEGCPVVVLVHSNRLRVLKTTASRRQVPLLFKLTDLEQTIIDRFMALWQGISGGDDKVPLFCNLVRPFDPLDDVQIRSDLARLIKQATCNNALSLHHARHAFANQAARLLLVDAKDCWTHASVAPVGEDHAKHIRSLLLSTHAVTRRSAWALARLLGHAHPRTTFRSYLHLVPEVSTRLVKSMQDQLSSTTRIEKLSSVLDLDRATIVDDYLEKLELTPVARPPITMQSLLRFYFLYQQGSSVALAATSTGLPARVGQELVEELNQIDQILSTRPAINPLLAGRSRLLSHISNTRWKYWIDRAAAISTVINTDNLDHPRGTVAQYLPIGPSRQVLLYQEKHFELLRQLIEMWSLKSSDLKIVGSTRLHPMVTQWASDHGFELTSVELVKMDGSNVQIDSATEGTPPLTVKHRCAVLFSGHPNADVKSSFELVVLMVVASLMLSSFTDGNHPNDTGT